MSRIVRLLLGGLSTTLSTPIRCIMAASSAPRCIVRKLTTMSAAAAAPHTISHRRPVGSPLPPTPGAEGCLYLDYAATCPIYPDVAEAMVPYFSVQWGNPSSPHAFGWATKAACDRARARVATMLGCSPGEVVFTSCGSEADNWAIIGAVDIARERLGPEELPHIVTSTIEHPAITECIASLIRAGRATSTHIAVDGWGRVDPAAVAEALRPETAIVTIMHANNEVGTIQPVAAIAAAVRARYPRVLVHTDAAQSVGKVCVDVRQLGVDMLTVVGHKFGAPKGIGALYVREGLRLPNLLHGGGQEKGRRAGTECIPLIVGLGEAAAIWMEQGDAIAEHSAARRDQLLAALEKKLGKERIRCNSPIAFSPSTGSDDWPALPNVLSVGIRGAKNYEVLGYLQDKVATSATAACHSHSRGVSGVLSELNVPVEYAVGTLRLSVGRHTTEAEVEKASSLIADCVKACDSVEPKANGGFT